MHALFVSAQLNDQEAADQSLHRDVIPQMQQAPGFSAGTWFGDGRTGYGLVLFDTEEHAKQAAPPVNTDVLGVLVQSVHIYPVTGQA